MTSTIPTRRVKDFLEMGYEIKGTNKEDRCPLIQKPMFSLTNITVILSDATSLFTISILLTPL